MMLGIKVGSRIISGRTGKLYIVEEIHKTDVKCKDTEGGGHTWLIRSHINDKNFYFDR